jgi:hypothetical protein
MDHNAFYHRPASAGFGFQLGQLALGHFTVGLVIEGDSLPAAREFSRGAEKQYHRAGVRVASLLHDGGRIYWFVGELNHDLGQNRQFTNRRGERSLTPRNSIKNRESAKVRKRETKTTQTSPFSFVLSYFRVFVIKKSAFHAKESSTNNLIRR